MERTISQEEKIRRAEEIYLRRKSGYGRGNIAKVNVSQEKDFKLFKKMILQILICFVIYFIYYLIQNSNYIFSEDVINKTKEILSYDIDLQGIYVEVTKLVKDLSLGISTQESNSVTNSIEENNESDNQNNENSIENNTENDNSQNEQEKNASVKGVSQALVQNEGIESTKLAMNEEEKEEIEQTNEEGKEEIEQTNEEYIKSNYSFIKPVEGVISSEFGPRNVDNPIVSKNHKGIDIAANLGSEIKASMEGMVTVSSTTGDYGYHIEIKNEDVTTLYAHCSELDVKEGDNVAQGQIIAKVGDTGKATSAHLHFEIRRNDTYINPRDILEF